MAKEDPAQREARLQRMRECSAASRARKRAESSEADKDAQREYDRNRKKEHVAKETRAQREVRLQKRRDYRSQSLYGEPAPEKRPPRSKNELLDYDLAKKERQRANETPEHREARLEKKRENSAARRANKTTTTSLKVKDAQRDRMVAFRAKRTSDQVQQDREAARVGMAKLRESLADKLDEGKGERRGKNHHDFTCKVRKYRLQVAKGIDPGPEELMDNGEPIYCHFCDRDPSLPVVGKGRCPCFSCAKLFGRA